jgi:uncharacterized protein (DUF39 family)
MMKFLRAAITCGLRILICGSDGMIAMQGGKKTLEEVTLGILDELGAAVRPARYCIAATSLQRLSPR